MSRKIPTDTLKPVSAVRSLFCWSRMKMSCHIVRYVIGVTRKTNFLEKVIGLGDEAISSNLQKAAVHWDHFLRCAQSRHPKGE